MKHIHAPNLWLMPDENPRLFLAGSIEMGKAEDWQAKVVKGLQQADVTVLNPRRPDWDASWKQDPSFAPFREQVEWEQLAISKSQIILFYFAPGTMSPISLLELGICLNRWWESKLIVCCPKEYQRWGNVVITCEMHNEKVYGNLDEAIARVHHEIKQYHGEKKL
jgi:hypothetical protein